MRNVNSSPKFLWTDEFSYRNAIKSTFHWKQPQKENILEKISAMIIKNVGIKIRPNVGSSNEHFINRRSHQKHWSSYVLSKKSPLHEGSLCHFVVSNLWKQLSWSNKNIATGHPRTPLSIIKSQMHLRFISTSLKWTLYDIFMTFYGHFMLDHILRINFNTKIDSQVFLSSKCN